MVDLPIEKRLKPHDIICLGASAGGLEALERFFRHLPPDPQHIFVVIQHLSPDYKSVMGELLGRFTHLKNQVVTDGMEPTVGCIHLIPPDRDMFLEGGLFHLRQRVKEQQHLPINLFLLSLAREQGAQAAAIILSGTGSDGSRGVEAIHQAGGLVLVQRPESAKFDGMPRSALLTGCVDYIGDPEELADLLFGASDEQRRQLRTVDGGRSGTPPQPVLPSTPLERIFYALSQQFSIDFQHYKEATIQRRIQRRITITRSIDMAAYAQRLDSDPQEVDLLYHDLLIGVTSFFRDPEVFTRLRQQILPELVQTLPAGQTLRLWVAGCSSGEEAYSLAILLDELLQELSLAQPLGGIQIFATDIHRDSLRRAAAGIYSEERMVHVSPERRANYFEQIGEEWRVRPALRRMITFAQHNLLRDPPFFHIHLISCRNLLIYFLKDAQQRTLLQFAAALEKGGVLALGSSESMLDSQQEFTTLDSHLKLYRKNVDLLPATLQQLLKPCDRLKSNEPLGERSRGRTPADLLGRIYPALLESCMPPGFLVAHDGELLHTFGDAGRYLHISGRMSSDLGAILRGNLRVAVTTALERARKTRELVYYTAVQHPLPEQAQQLLDISVTPLSIHANRSVSGSNASTTAKTEYSHFFIHIANAQSSEPLTCIPSSLEEAARLRIETLERELFEARENLQTTVEELETSNEELQATNEELLATNEELQSSNEELQSVNEELHSVNAEYQEKNNQLIDLNDDLQNLMSCTEIGTIFVDQELRIRRFTATIGHLFFVREQDIGRPLQEIKSRLYRGEEEGEQFLKRVRQVLQSGQTLEHEVKAENQLSLLQRIHPYRDSFHQVSGVVITYVDLTQVKENELLRRQADILRGDILNSLNANICVVDGEGQIIAINEAWRDFARHNQAQDFKSFDIGASYFAACVCGSDSREYHDAQQAMAGLREILAGRVPLFEMEYPCHAQNQQRWFLMRVTPLRRAEGGAVIAHNDITVQKQAVAERLESEMRLQTVFNALDAVVYVSDLESHKILYINETGRQLFGDVINLTCWSAIQGQSAPCTFCHADQLFTADGSPNQNLVWEVKCEKNGRWYESRDHAVKWLDGRYVRLTLLSDISERKAMEQELRNHRDHLSELVEEQTLSIQAILESAADAIITIDQQGEILTFNPAAQKMFGYSAEESIGHNINLLMPEPHRSEHNHYLHRYLEGATPKIIGKSTEVTAQRRNGTTFPLMITVSEMVIGKERRFTGIARDITIQKESERELIASREAAEAASRAKGDFLANMSHEIRTPMNAIIGLSELLLHNDLTAEQRDRLNKIHSSSQMLLAIINDILDYSKIESGKLQLDPHPFRLSTLLEQIQSLFEQATHAKQITLQLKVENQVPEVLEGDALRLGQVLTNLLSNAIKFTHRGEVILSIQHLDQQEEQVELRFAVSDQGIGMSEEQLNRLFQAFSQADTSTTRKYGGTGLGLTISKRLVELMGGKLEVQSTLGEGSCFRFTLPLLRCTSLPPEESLPALSSLEAGRTTFEGLSILLVEDNNLNQEVVIGMLGDSGMQITIANHGAEAVTLARHQPFDLILMDIQMPVMDGLEATRQIRQQHPELPIIALSAAVLEEDRKQALDAGMNDHLAKPINRAKLYQTLCQWLKKKTPDTPLPPTSSGVLPNRLKGFDLVRGLRSVDGDTQLYLKILHLFSDQLNNQLCNLPQQLHDDSNNTLAATLHTLKGLAGQAGATQLATLATNLEDHLHQQQPISDTARQHFLDTLEEVRQQLATLQPAPPNTASLAPEQLAAAIEQLSSALRTNRVISDRQLHPILNSLKQHCPAQQVEQLQQLIEHLQYREAAIWLDQLLASADSLRLHRG